jgi:hypothetical protein
MKPTGGLMGNGKTQNWLPLLNYSTQHNISLSTLRRRIKAHTIEYKLDQGKYFILEDGEREIPTPVKEYPQQSVIANAPQKIQESNYVEASVLTSANRLVEEIKSAYAKILQEKEEQISLLKEEISDLKMLVRILESQSELRSELKSASLEKKSDTADAVPESGFEDQNFLFGDYQDRDL